MSILEKIIKTETRVQEEIKSAKNDATKLLSDAREKGSSEALTIRNSANEKINEIEVELKKKTVEIENRLASILENQSKELKEAVSDKLDKIIKRTFQEAISK